MATTTKHCTPLTKDARPTHLTLATLHRELNSYAIKPKTQQGGGSHDYLALLLTNEDYLAIAMVVFVTPKDPGDDPVHQPGATAAQIIEGNRAHTANLIQYNNYHAMENKLKPSYLKPSLTPSSRY